MIRDRANALPKSSELVSLSLVNIPADGYIPVYLAHHDQHGGGGARHLEPGLDNIRGEDQSPESHPRTAARHHRPQGTDVIL